MAVSRAFNVQGVESLGALGARSSALLGARGGRAAAFHASQEIKANEHPVTPQGEPEIMLGYRMAWTGGPFDEEIGGNLVG